MTSMTKQALAIVGVVTATAIITSTMGPADGAPAGHARAIPHTAPTYQSSNSETSYVPITPCRLVDTRTFHHPLANNAVRTYYVTGASGFGPQGGQSGGCGIPNGAVAIAANMVAVNAHSTGIMRMWPSDQSEPNATAIVYPKTAKVGASATLSLNQSSPQALRVKNYGGLVDLAIDVTGYYVKPLAGFISPSGSPYSGSSRILSAARTGVGVYEVQFDRNIRYCAATATVYVSSYYAAITTWFDSTRPDTLRVSVYDANGNPADQYVYVNVEC
jgi:hypothetical protein